MRPKLLLGLLCTLLFAVGCVSDPITVTVPQNDNLEINLSGSIDQTPVSRVNDEGFCDGDGIGVYVVNYQDGVPGTLLNEGNQVDNVRYVYNESETKWTPDYPVYYYDKVTPVDIIGYYPYTTNISVNAYSFEVAKDQSTDANNGLMGGYEASDFLWGVAEGISPTSSRVNITLNHMMAGVQVRLTEGTGWGENEWSGLDKQVLVSNTIRKATINLANGDVSPVGEVPTTGIVPAKSGEGWRAVVVPQTVEASMSLLNITVDGTSYIYRKNSAFEYVAGKLHKFTIEVSKKSESGLEFKLVGEDITPWESETITHDGTAREYVVINVPAASTEENVSALKAAIEASGKDYTKIKNLKVTGEVNAFDFYFMRDEMTALQGINMKEVSIAAVRDWYPAKVIPNNAFADKRSVVRFVFPENITTIGDNAFSGTSLTGDIVIPNGVVSIGYGAFGPTIDAGRYVGLPIYGTLTLPESLKYIGQDAFNSASLLGELKLPSSIEYIGDCAFGYNEFSGELILPENLKELGSRAFACNKFKGSLKIPYGVTRIPGECFWACSFNGELNLHDNIQYIDIGAFEMCAFRGELNLPKNIVSIGERAFRWNLFSGTLVFPENISSISNEAFAENKRLTGIIEFPSNITTIPSGIFYGCDNIEGVILNKGTRHIMSNAFCNCFYLNTIVCDALVPPTLDASAFDGVAKDNFVLEVPEASVSDYTLAPNWKEFKRIAAHREFSISRNLFRTLNASNTKTLILRAESGAAWSVESCPEWVTVSPSSGVGKTEITISVNEMTAVDVATFDVETYESWGSTTSTTYNGRAGEVVFLLDGKDYRTRTKVEQYDYEYGDGDVITNQTATKGNGVNIVFMGDCFDAQDIATGKYLDGINEAIGYFFAVEPYATYKDYFNVYTVFGLSPDSGMGTVNTIREAKFGSQYMLNEGLQTDGNTCFEYACKTPTVTKENIHQTPIVLIENSYEYGGVTQMWNNGSAIAICPMIVDEYPYDYRGVVQHEAGGHAFGKLGDEYIYHNGFIAACPFCGGVRYLEVLEAHSLGWYRNLSLTGNIYDVSWSHLIFDEKYQNTVDIYEGGCMHTRGCFRSEQNSCMNNNIPYFSAISRQAIAERIMEYAGEEFSFEEWKAKDKGIYTGSTSSATRMAIESSVVVSSSASHQQPPKFMGEKPELNF